MRSKKTTHPLLAAIVTWFISMCCANFAVDFFFASAPDKYVLPAEYPIPVALACITYYVAMLERNRSQELSPWICRRCGYDLRASKDRCPECGAACKAASPAGASPAAGIDDLPA